MHISTLNYFHIHKNIFTNTLKLYCISSNSRKRISSFSHEKQRIREETSTFRRMQIPSTNIFSRHIVYIHKCAQCRCLSLNFETCLGHHDSPPSNWLGQLPSECQLILQHFSQIELNFGLLYMRP